MFQPGWRFQERRNAAQCPGHNDCSFAKYHPATQMSYYGRDFEDQIARSRRLPNFLVDGCLKGEVVRIQDD